MLNYTEQCCDCVALVCDSGAWFCDEYEIPCDSVIDCNEWDKHSGITASEFCEFFDFTLYENTEKEEIDGYVPKYIARDNQLCFYPRYCDDYQDFAWQFDVCFDNYVYDTLCEYGYDGKYNFENMQQWIERSCEDLLYTDTYNVLAVLNGEKFTGY